VIPEYAAAPRPAVTRPADVRELRAGARNSRLGRRSLP